MCLYVKTKKKDKLYLTLLFVGPASDDNHFCGKWKTLTLLSMYSEGRFQVCTLREAGSSTFPSGSSNSC